MEEQIKTLKQELNKMEISNLSDAECKPLVIRVFKELSEDLSSIKNIHSEAKDTLIKMENNLQGNNSRVDEDENQINNLEHKESKNNQNNKKKKDPKDRISTSGKTSRGATFTSDGCQKERKSKKLEIFLKK